MKTLYCLSGLGADERIFSRLSVPGVEFRYLSWLKPVPNESLRAYTMRLAEGIDEEHPILMGLSFGGMVCLELAKILRPSKVILLSSIKSGKELPFWMKACGLCRLDALLPRRQISSIPLIKKLRPIQNYFLGAKTEAEKKIANQYRETVDPEYLRWSIHQVLTWKNTEYPAELIQIHGDQDHIFPIGRIEHPTHIIKGGGHFMVMNQHREISAVLQQVI